MPGTDVVERQLVLDDGRVLAYAEAGRPAGPVVVLCHPSTRVLQPGWASAVDALGIRLLFPDRPGFGDSTFKPDLTILDWPADVAALLAHLEVDRCVVAGVSASTPHALACGVALAERVGAVGILAGTVPLADDERTGIALLAVEDPAAAFAAVRDERGGAVDHEAGARRTAQRPAPDGPLYAQPEVQAALIAASEATYRQGVDGPSWDTVLRLRPWGFGLGDVVVPVRWWHGDSDAVVPIDRIERAIAGFGHHRLTTVAGSGHGVCMTHVEPFLRALLAVAGADDRS